MPTAVVTGGAGFLGSHLCDHLVSKGYRVICIDNLDTGSLQNVEHLREDDFLFINQDVTLHLDIDEPVDVVYHLAALASPIDYLRMPLHSLKVGSYGTHNALGLAKFKRARFLLASTSEVYGDPQVHPQPETYWGNVNPIGPRGVLTRRSGTRRRWRWRTTASRAWTRRSPGSSTPMGLACVPATGVLFRRL
jgi:dTDP-glucose 4,6-dehydratase